MIRRRRIRRMMRKIVRRVMRMMIRVMIRGSLLVDGFGNVTKCVSFN